MASKLIGSYYRELISWRLFIVTRVESDKVFVVYLDSPNNLVAEINKEDLRNPAKYIKEGQVDD